MDEPRARPADAYFLVSSMVEPAYLRRPPPCAGVRLTIVGRDGVATQWDMDEETAASLDGFTERRWLSVVRSVSYDDQPAG